MRSVKRRSLIQDGKAWLLNCLRNFDHNYFLYQLYNGSINTFLTLIPTPFCWVLISTPDIVASPMATSSSFRVITATVSPLRKFSSLLMPGMATSRPCETLCKVVSRTQHLGRCLIAFSMGWMQCNINFLFCSSL